VNAADPARDPKPLLGRLVVLVDDHHSARAHVLLFAHDLWNSQLAVIRESLSWVLQETSLRARLRGGHRRRKVNEPMRVDSKPAHHLERSRGVLLRNRDVPDPARLDDA